MKKVITLAMVLSGMVAYAQKGNLGINTQQPKATLEIQPAPINLNGNTNEGLLAPKLTKARIANIADANLVEGTLVYATDATGATSNPKVAKITENGYYFYNGNEWVKTIGTQGPKGETGVAGPQGPQGPAGPKGDTGVLNVTKGLKYDPPSKTLSLPTGSNLEQVLKWNGSAWDPALDTNIYTTDGNLAGARTVNMNGNNLIFTGNGNVGIGINNPTAKLDVSGDIRTNAVIYNSDARLKTNVTNMSNATATINGLRSVNYYWNADGKKKGGNDQLQYGFIAQEVEKVLPALVNTDDKGYKSVNYVAVVPVLVKSLQEKDEEIQALKNKVEQMKKDVEEIKRMLKK